MGEKLINCINKNFLNMKYHLHFATHPIIKNSELAHKKLYYGMKLKVFVIF